MAVGGLGLRIFPFHLMLYAGDLVAEGGVGVGVSYFGFFLGGGGGPKLKSRMGGRMKVSTQPSGGGKVLVCSVVSGVWHGFMSVGVCIFRRKWVGGGGNKSKIVRGGKGKIVRGGRREGRGTSPLFERRCVKRDIATTEVATRVLHQWHGSQNMDLVRTRTHTRAGEREKQLPWFAARTMASEKMPILQFDIIVNLSLERSRYWTQE